MSNTQSIKSLCLPPELSPAQFLAEYWQKKPLLIRNGLPAIVDQLEPDDVMELATFDDVTARLLTQDDSDPDSWQLKLSPLTQDDIEHTPKLWTLLVQNLEQWSMDIANLWQHFSFIPQWQRDDIMVSYAPKGGSVGKHYDQYDVFLVQGFGHRRWQLGKFCNEKTPFIPNQPLRLLDDMGDIIFDEVLAPGDVLYVPPGLSHYGVAEDDCLTFSFGLRRPSPISLLDASINHLVDQHAQAHVNTVWQQPTPELPLPAVNEAVNATVNNALNHNGEVTEQTISTLKQRVLDQLAQSTELDEAIAKCLSERRFELLQEEEPMEAEIMLSELSCGAHVVKEPAVKLLYTTEPSLKLFCQGEQIDDLFPQQEALLKRLADGENLALGDFEGFDIDALCSWVNNGWIALKL